MNEVNVTALSDGEITRLGPVQIRVLEGGSRTDNRIGAVEITLPLGTPGPPQHFHVMHDETFLVTSGTVPFIIGDAERDIHAGDYVVVPPGAAHTFANTTSEPAVFFNTFTPAFYVQYFRDLGKLTKDGLMTPERANAVRDPSMVKNSEGTGFPLETLRPFGLFKVIIALLSLVPATAFIGVILATGWMGEPSPPMFA